MTETLSEQSPPVEDVLPERPVKLVIWDLDETFWKGTLAEEGIEPFAEHGELVRTLAGRGIVSSICSKNDFDVAREQLQRLNVWEYFVFPVIQWSAKGPAIRELIQRANRMCNQKHKVGKIEVRNLDLCTWQDALRPLPGSLHSARFRRNPAVAACVLTPDRPGRTAGSARF